jgi:hypothetical protein
MGHSWARFVIAFYGLNDFIVFQMISGPRVIRSFAFMRIVNEIQVRKHHVSMIPAVMGRNYSLTKALLVHVMSFAASADEVKDLNDIATLYWNASLVVNNCTHGSVTTTPSTQR